MMKAITLAVLAGVSLHAQWFKQATVGIPRTADGKPDLTAPVPRAPDGKPDLSGLWTINAGPNATDITKQLAEGDVQPWAKEVHQQRKENLGRDSFAIHCLPEGPLYSIAGAPEGVKIVQTPALIVFLYGDLVFRQVYLDGRDLPQDPNPTWLGYSVGRWDGDTLVVESNGFNDRTWIDFEGHPHSEGLLMTERYHRTDLGHMDIEVTFRDPQVYAKPMTVASKMDAMFDTAMLEYVCAENERDREHLVGTASDDKAVEVAPEILSRYTGKYEMQPPPGVPSQGPLLFSVDLVEGKLEMSLPGGVAAPLRAISETRFTTGGGTVEFVTNDQGAVTHIVLSAVEGEFEAKRKE